MITQEYLKSILHYNPDTGIFTWVKTNKMSCKKTGDVAGKTKIKHYISITIDNYTYKAHRLAWLYMTGSFPNDFIDHLDRVKYNNKWKNLRSVTPAGNCRNRKLKSDNTSGVSGVNFNKASKKWIVRLCVDNDRKYYGAYKTLKEATEVRSREIKKLDFSPTHGIKV